MTTRVRCCPGGTRHDARHGDVLRRAAPALPSRERQEGLTLPTSTRLVTMTMLAEFSCQIILQKSFTVSCIGPANREGDRVRGCQCQEAAKRVGPFWLVS